MFKIKCTKDVMSGRKAQNQITSTSPLTVMTRATVCEATAMTRPRSGELRTQKWKSHLVRTQSLNVLPFKPGVGQYIAKHATPGSSLFRKCQGVLPCLFLPFQSIHLHLFQNLSQFFPVLACRIKWVTLLDAGSCVESPQHINSLRKHDLWKNDDLWNNI